MPIDFLLDACDEVGFSWDSSDYLQNVANWMGREVKVQKDCAPQRTFDALRPLSLLSFTNSQMLGRAHVNPKLSQGDRFSNLLCHAKSDSKSSYSASGEGGVNFTWGGKEGVKYSPYAKGQVCDKNGNSAQASITQNNDGTGSGNVSVTVKKDFNSKN